MMGYFNCDWSCILESLCLNLGFSWEYCNVLKAGRKRYKHVLSCSPIPWLHRQLPEYIEQAYLFSASNHLSLFLQDLSHGAETFQDSKMHFLYGKEVSSWNVQAYGSQHFNWGLCVANRNSTHELNCNIHIWMNMNFWCRRRCSRYLEFLS